MTAMRGETCAAVVIALALTGCAASQTDRSGRPLPQQTAATGAPGPTTGGSGSGSSPITQGDNPGGPIMLSAGTSSSGGAGIGLPEGKCANKDISTMRVVPTIWLVVDGSGSMVDMLGDKSRWIALREALMDPTNGVVKTLEREVKWGMIMYDGKLDFPVPLPDGGVAMFTSPPATMCPRVVAVEPKKDNFADIDKVYPPDPLGGSTPTHKALEQVIQHLPMGTQIGPDQMSGPTIVVLATDGAPNDMCAMVDFLAPPPDVRQDVIAAVKKLAAGGNKTYVISLAGGDNQLTQHLTQVAQAGDTGKPPFIPMSKDELVQTFKDIIGPAAACDVKLNGKGKVGSECKGGKLEINGVPLACGDPNGWHLKDESTISITGTACEMYQGNLQAQLHADFPCDVFTLN